MKIKTRSMEREKDPHLYTKTEVKSFLSILVMSKDWVVYNGQALSISILKQ